MNLKTIRQASLQTRLLFFFLVVLLAVVLLVVFTTISTAYDHSSVQLQRQLDTAQQVLTYKLQNDSAKLENAMELAAKDFSLKQLVASGKEDPESLKLAIVNQQRRMNADLAAVYGGDERLLLTTVSGELGLTPSALQQEPLSIYEFAGDLYLVHVVAMKFLEQQPRVDAWLLMGVKLQHLIDADVETLTGFDVSVFNGQQFQFSTSGQDNTSLDSATELDLGQISTLESAAGDLILYRFALGDRSSTSFVFTISSGSAFLDFFKLVFQLGIEVVVALIAALFLSLYFSRDITRPLRTLASVATRIQQGDYRSPIPDFQTAEVAQLSSAFQGMQQGIQQREEEINQLAFYDALTGMPNRNSFVKRLQDLIEEDSERPFAVMMLDLDRFKEVNDTIGHNFGDKLLQHIAQRLQSLNMAGSFYARVGGDEFAALFTELDACDADSLLQQYETLFDVAFVVEGIRLDVDASFGLALYPAHADSAYGIMQCADIALYRCKETHHRGLIYSEEFNTLTLQRLNLMSELREAIKDDQLQLFYQPQLCLLTNQVVSVECLVRWVHPEHGFIVPDDFIPLAEQTGAIRDLTHWAINTALKQHVEWRERYKELVFAVNVSAVDLLDLSLPGYVANQLSQHGVDARYLSLEVTESSLMAEPEAAINALGMLHRMGIALSIDDFGTGYSSMAYLKDLPVSELKIDKAFVLNLASNGDDKKIVKSVVDLAHNLGLKVVAEGVEDHQSLAILKANQVEFAQGYHIAKPMNPDDFSRWMESSELVEVAPL